MRVFVAGASGAVGRPLVPKLVAAGHEVTGMTRSEARAEGVRAAGARAAVVDVFDADALQARDDRGGPRGRGPPADRPCLERMNFRKKDLYAGTNRVRTEGTRNLIRGGAGRGRPPLPVAEHRVRLPPGRRAA